MKIKKIINCISAVAAVSAIIISLSFISGRVNDYKERSEAVSSSVSYIEAEPAENENKKYEQIISEEKTPVAAAEASAPIEAEAEEPAPEYALPADGDIISDYSEDEIIYLEETKDFRAHTGIDIETNGAGAKAVADGTVYDLYEDINNNYVLIIDHADFRAIFKNIIVNTNIVKDLQVKKGEVLGKGIVAENGGEYIHFEVEKDGKKENPIKYFK